MVRLDGHSVDPVRRLRDRRIDRCSVRRVPTAKAMGSCGRERYLFSDCTYRHMIYGFVVDLYATLCRFGS